MFNFIKFKIIINEFISKRINFFISSVYIARSSLLKAIKKNAKEINGRVLDFGCGSKPYESIFTNAIDYIGLDIKSSGHNHIYSKVDFFYDGKTLPFPDNNFDVVVCFEVFEHVFNLEELLIEINRVLKKDGKLLISIPFAWDEHEIPFDFARYTSFGIAHILSKNGFQVIELKKTKQDVVKFGSVSSKYRRGRESQLDNRVATARDHF
jgi:SAM-dependent methyltransferase